MSTIDIDKKCICDGCFKTVKASDRQNNIIRIEFNRTHRAVYLCEKCTRDLLEGLKKELEVK